ncbi:MAG: TIR domain-containing protein [Burkholderiales bacterium]
MARIFICYSRQSEAAVKALANDIDTLGHDVWFDQELSGGQAWWDQILVNIRNSDVVLVTLAPEAVKSVAVKREYGYATDLGKPILPVVVAEGISAGLLPPALSTVQFVDYQVQDRNSALRLARAISAMPPPKPLPQALPQPPEVPISYLGGLREQVEAITALEFAEQSALLVKLKRSLRDPDTAKDGRTLLESLRMRRDLFATIAEEINELLGNPATASPSSRHSPEAGRSPVSGNSHQTEATRTTVKRTHVDAAKPAITRLPRLKSALAGAVIGTILGAFIYSALWSSVSVVIFMGIGGILAGAIIGTRPRLIAASIVGVVFGYGMSLPLGGLYLALNLGAPAGAILGAIVGVLLTKKTIQFSSES